MLQGLNFVLNMEENISQGEFVQYFIIFTGTQHMLFLDPSRHTLTYQSVKFKSESNSFPILPGLGTYKPKYLPPIYIVIPTYQQLVVSGRGLGRLPSVGGRPLYTVLLVYQGLVAGK